MWWFRNNKMILNPKKCKALVLARKPNVKLSLFAEGVALPLVDTVSRSVWANIGRFPEFWKTFCRLKNLLPFRTKLYLYNSFIMSHFHYFFSIWRGITAWSLIGENWIGCMNEHLVACTVTSLHKLALFFIVLVRALWIDVSRTRKLLYLRQ